MQKVGNLSTHKALHLHVHVPYCPLVTNFCRLMVNFPNSLVQKVGKGLLHGMGN